MAIEIERKFKVKNLEAAIKDHVSCRDITQGYLDLQGTTRIRHVSCNSLHNTHHTFGYITVKGKGLKVRQEFEYAIPPEDAMAMLGLAKGILINKVRYEVPLSGPNQGLILEVDVFFGQYQGMVLAEVELPTEDTPFTPPDFLGEEVTYDKSFSNARLALGSKKELVCGSVVSGGVASDTMRNVDKDAIPLTYLILTIMLGVTSFTAYGSLTFGGVVGEKKIPYMVDLVIQHPIAFVLAFLGTFFVTLIMKGRSSALDQLLVPVFPAVSGIFIGPSIFLANVEASTKVGATLSANPVRDSVVLTLGCFLALTAYAAWSKRDFSFLGGFLLVGLVAVILASFLAIFLQSTILSLAISSVAILIFSGYVLYDTSEVMQGRNDPFTNALSLYLDFLNLFLNILRLLSSSKDLVVDQ